MRESYKTEHIISGIVVDSSITAALAFASSGKSHFVAFPPVPP